MSFSSQAMYTQLVTAKESDGYAPVRLNSKLIGSDKVQPLSFFFSVPVTLTSGQAHEVLPASSKGASALDSQPQLQKLIKAVYAAASGHVLSVIGKTQITEAVSLNIIHTAEYQRFL
jgi:hypothetical protein